MNQSGPTFDVPGSSYQGNDNYFDHVQYREGWSYLGRTIGAPFIMPQNEVQSSARIGQFFPNNRLKMACVGANGQVSNVLNWIIRLAYSQNYGTYSASYPIIFDQVSALASVRWRLPRPIGT